MKAEGTCLSSSSRTLHRSPLPSALRVSSCTATGRAIPAARDSEPWRARAVVSPRPGGHPERRRACKLATVDRQRGPCDEAGRLRAEPDARVRDLARLPDAPEWHRPRGRLLARGSRPPEVVGEDRPGGECVDPYSLTRIVERGDLRETLDAMLGGDVAREPADRLQSRGRAHVHDGPA